MGSNIETKSWTIAGLVSDIDNSKIILPRFQRAQVWTMSKQKKLVKSIANDFPIGSFLVYEDKRTGTCQLIDGLQRATAIYRYHKEPLKYIDFEDLMGHDDISDAFESIVKACETQFQRTGLLAATKDAISSWLPETDIYSSSTYDAYSLAERIVAHFVSIGVFDDDQNETLLKQIAIAKEIKQSGFLDKLKIEVSLDSYTFPVIFYSGDKKNLPEIFDRINVEGMKLSKYDILAASWYGDHTRVVIRDKKLQHAIEQKYASAQDNGFEIEGLDHTDDEYTLFEYLFGLGKMIADDEKYRILFRGSRGENAVESFAFTIACIVYGLRLSELHKLPNEMLAKSSTATSATLDPEKFTAALIDSIEFVTDVLKGYIGIELQKPFIAHTEYQICSYIARALIGKYDVSTWRVNDGWPTDSKNLRTYIPQHYLYELLSNFWGNAGDSKLFNNVWQGKVASLEYDSGYTKEQWTSVLNTWFNIDMRKKQRARSAIEPNDKIILKYIYGQIATAAEEKAQFDIDHLYPVKLLVSKISELGDDTEGWPISAVGNLAFIQHGINIKKSARTLGEYYSALDPNEPEDAKRRGILDRYALVDDPAKYDADDSWGYDEYIDFLNMRNETIKNMILRRFGID